jgi:hypothetical protein
MARIRVCEVCGTQFLDQGPNRHGTTCSGACRGWSQLKNKGQEQVPSQADPARHEREIAEKDRT